METVLLRHPGDARVTTTRTSTARGPNTRSGSPTASSSGPIRAPTAWAPNDRSATGRAAWPTRDFPGPSTVYEPVTPLPAETLPETFVHPAGYCQNVLATGRCTVTGTDLVVGREAILLECDHPRTTELRRRPARLPHRDRGRSRDGRHRCASSRPIGGTVTRHAEATELAARRPAPAARPSTSSSPPGRRCSTEPAGLHPSARDHRASNRRPDHERPRRGPRHQASAPPRAGGDGPRWPDRHDRRRHHGHAGPAGSASGSRARRSSTGSSRTAPTSARTCWARTWR